MKLKVTLSIGYAGAAHEDIIDIGDEELEDLTPEERESVYANAWLTWANNYIEGGWTVEQ